jgi:hypothetical protein
MRVKFAEKIDGLIGENWEEIYKKKRRAMIHLDAARSRMLFIFNNTTASLLDDVDEIKSAQQDLSIALSTAMESKADLTAVHVLRDEIANYLISCVELETTCEHNR